MAEALRIENLSKAFDSQGEHKRILDKLNLTIDEREFVCVLGPSGCGKSTMLRCIAGFEKYEGTIYCNGRVVNRPAADRIMVFQDYNQLFPWKTVEANVQYPLRVTGIRDRKRLKRISDEYLAKVNLSGYQRYYPHELSGGMKQRVAIAKALALKPGIILMDEPFAALDAITRNKLQRELYRIARDEQLTVIFITHNIQEALTQGTRVLLMSQDGDIVIDKTNTLERPVKPSVRGYGEMWDLFSRGLEGIYNT